MIDRNLNYVKNHEKNFDPEFLHNGNVLYVDDYTWLIRDDLNVVALTEDCGKSYKIIFVPFYAALMPKNDYNHEKAIEEMIGIQENESSK